MANKLLVVCDTAKVRFFKQITTGMKIGEFIDGCLRYCKSTIFQANHNGGAVFSSKRLVVCDTAKVRFFKQITTGNYLRILQGMLFAILQKYDFSSKSQRAGRRTRYVGVVCDTAKVRFFKQITTLLDVITFYLKLFAILQKYDFSSKSQRCPGLAYVGRGCLRYCKSTIFQANHNRLAPDDG